MKREEYEERMKDSKYRELVVTNCDSGEDYVFISYRGNSWKTVLTEIVYKLQKEYNLRIYFDKEFASETNIWIEQFIKNMDSSHCKACLCFFDEGYVTSYATLLELMHAMNPRSRLGESIFPVSFPINWGELNSADWNTGLGVMDPDNPGWEEEKQTFDREFNIIKKRYPSVEDYYYEGAELRGCDCKDIMAILQPKNKRDYADEDAYYRQFVVDPLKKKCPSVFAEAGSRKKESRTAPETDEGKGVCNPDGGTGPDAELNIRYNATIDEIRKIFSERETVQRFSSVRGMVSGGKSYMDYVMAVIFGGCNGVSEKSPVYQQYYYLYAIAQTTKTDGKLGATWTWGSGIAKTVLGIDIRKIPDSSDEYFRNLDTNIRLADIGGWFIREEPEMFKVKKKEKIIISLNNLSDFMDKELNGKKGIAELL